MRRRSTRRGLLAGWVCALASALAPAFAATPDAPVADPEPDSTEPAAPPAWVASTRLDRLGRIMAPVYVNGAGPFAFVVDTGASRSAIAPRLVEALGLQVEPSATVTLRGITGTQQVPSIRVARIEYAHVRLTDQRLPVVRPGIFADADGILGVDGLEGSCVHADFRRETLVIERGRCPRAEPGWLSAKAQLRFGRLFTVKGRVGPVPVRIIVDTGAERSLGNAALREALERRGRKRAPTAPAEVIGATWDTMPGDMLAAPVIHIGEMDIASAYVTFGEFDVFDLWGLGDEPALLLGMDVIGVADALMIDYARGEFRILPTGSSSRSSRGGRRLPLGG